MDTSSVWPVLLPILTAAFGVLNVPSRLFGITWSGYLLSFGRWQAEQLKSPQYLQFKSGTSLVFGVILGIMIMQIYGDSSL